MNLNVRQVTTYPSSGAVTIEIEPSRSASFELQLRIPAWAKGATLSVNGQAAAALQPGSFATLNRLWKPGDRVQLDLPMSFRLVRGRQQQAGRVAVLRGPLVFSLNPSADPALASLDAADLSRFTLDPASLELSTDDSLHPGGLACLAGAWKPGYATLPKHDLRLRLTEFADPAARATYFRLRDLSPAVPDELLAPPQRR
ncbi:MAG: glycoside hydrolase family 127 protein [Acidobacteria bacterium]|nr:glycoside hydrolase family 127 protein [Acidobacteriota bacterium]